MTTVKRHTCTYLMNNSVYRDQYNIKRFSVSSFSDAAVLLELAAKQPALNIQYIKCISFWVGLTHDALLLKVSVTWPAFCLKSWVCDHSDVACR